MKAKFGRYVFLKKLAVGGMAEIFLARRLSFGGFAKFVVLKRLLPEHRGKRAYEQLFLTEARIHAVLNHPHIVSLHDLGKLDDAYFMAMEYVHGVSAAELMARAAQRRKPLPLGCALRIVVAMAEALHYGHVTLDDLGEAPMGILHHDVSPHNIQVGYDGGVKLLDYGVATRIGHPAPGGRRGKPAYMSPEAIAKEELDHRSDLFSLAIVLYEMTLSRRLFKAGTAKETMARARAALVKPPREIDPDYPRDLETIVLRALARDRDRRFATGQDFANALKAFAEKQELDLGQDAFADYLGELFHSEVPRRQAELAALARASAESRQRGAAAPEKPAAPADDAAEAVEAASEEAAPEQAAPPAAPAAAAPPREAAETPAEDAEAADAPDAAEEDADADEAPARPDDQTLEERPVADDEEMATVVKPPSEMPLAASLPTPAPVADLGRTPTPTPIPVADVGDAQLDLGPERSAGSGEYDGEDALAYELPEEAKDQRPEWDEGTFAAPLQSARRRTWFVALGGLLLAVGAFFAGQRLPTLLSPTGRITVESDPAGARVESNGKAIGETPLKIEGLQVGDQLRLRVSKPGYGAVERKMTIYPDRLSREWTVTLDAQR